MNILEAEGIVKKYAEHCALNRVSLSIPKGSIFGLLGPNGAGKTSFIRIINQITAADEGTVIFDGEKLQSKHIANIGYLPEERGLYKNMKVGDQAIYLAQLKGMSAAKAKSHLKDWFHKFDILPWWNKKVTDLSKGMAQKVQFITTVLHEPKLLIFDEPFSGFDPINANLIRDEILELNKKGATIIFSTHRMESVEELCEYIALIHKSNKILDGKLSDIKRNFRSNTFQVGLVSDNKNNLRQELRSKFEIADTSFKSIDDELQLRIKLKPGMDSSDLLGVLASKSKVNHFTEVIPSANDIFIEAISKNS